MKVIEDLLTINEWSRPGKKLASAKSIIMHWTADPMATAKNIRDFFESRKNGKDGYGSAQYIVGLKGEIILCIPEDEVAYHCGSSQIDPQSKKIYTDWARAKFGSYATEKSSPNNVTIGIEMCTIAECGTFTEETTNSAIQLVRELRAKYSISKDMIGTHNMVVGWKDCPRLWTNNPGLFTYFLSQV
jgi:N-acetylmuramoyl-L-alanine amidase